MNFLLQSRYSKSGLHPLCQLCLEVHVAEVAGVRPRSEQQGASPHFYGWRRSDFFRDINVTILFVCLFVCLFVFPSRVANYGYTMALCCQVENAYLSSFSFI